MGAQPVVQAGACNTGAAFRNCTRMERGAAGWGDATRCPCPFTGGPSAAGVKRFTLRITYDVRPSILLNGTAFKVRYAVNGVTPGPTLIVNEGEWVEVTVDNALDVDETSIEFAGISNVLTPFSDGAATVTQCAIQPGNKMVYAFRASNAGTYLWHGSVNMQQSDGLAGLFVVKPAVSSPLEPPAYDSEALLVIGDYYSNTVRDLLSLWYLTPKAHGTEPVPDALVVNNLLSLDVTSDPATWAVVPVASPATAKTLFRVAAATALSRVTVSIDGVNLQLVELDATAVS